MTTASKPGAKRRPAASKPARKPPAAPARRLVSLVVPVLNEQDAIDAFFERVGAVLAPLASEILFEYVLVDDGSTDATVPAIRRWMAKGVPIRLVVLSRNFGKEAALAAGLKHALGTAAIPMDVDLQDPPEAVPEMIAKWRAGAMVVNARRVDRSEDSRAKRLSSAAYYRVFNLLAEYPIPENVGDFRLIDRQVIDILNRFTERSRFNKDLFNWVGFDTAEVALERPARAAGRSKWSFWKLWKFGLDGIFAASTLPLRIWSYIGAAVAALGFLYALYIFVTTLAFGAETPGYASTAILILFFGGLNMLSVGILGEYIGRIYREVQDRPLFLVRDVEETRGN